jgi:hypothetical protein
VAAEVQLRAAVLQIDARAIEAVAFRVEDVAAPAVAVAGERTYEDEAAERLAPALIRAPLPDAW